ncbi:MAG: choice-of-anchor D domain-containing protein [Candidatus Sulfotelmatobacter sp.]
MRLPQSVSQPLSVRTVRFLTISIAIALFDMVPVSAGSATPQLTCTPSSLGFGAVVVGHTEALLVTLTNKGETSVTVSGITASNSELTRSNLTLPLVLLAGHSVDLNVKFTPTAIGSMDGAIQFFSNASNAILVLSVGGVGASSESITASPSRVSFGHVATGTSSTISVVLTNARASSVTLSGLDTTGSGFSMSGPTLPLTLNAGQSVTVEVTFTPKTPDTDRGSLFVSGPERAIPLTGTGTVTQYTVNLFWDSSSGVAGYNVYRSTSANGTYSKINPSLDSNTAYTDGTVASGQTYYYAATSVSSSGQESTLSTPPVQAAVP